MHGEKHARIAVAADRAGVVEGARMVQCQVEGRVRQASHLCGVCKGAVWLGHLDDVMLASGILEHLHLKTCETSSLIVLYSTMISSSTDLNH